MNYFSDSFTLRSELAPMAALVIKRETSLASDAAETFQIAPYRSTNEAAIEIISLDIPASGDIHSSGDIARGVVHSAYENPSGFTPCLLSSREYAVGGRQAEV